MSKNIVSHNPATGEVEKEFTELSDQQVNEKVLKAEQAFQQWKNFSVEDRAEMLKNAGKILLKNKQELAGIITMEMGKPLKESVSEIEKCAWACDFYAERAAEFLQPKIIETDADKSYVAYHPLGIVLAIMPWNFPFWQVFRFAAPNLVAGNVGLLKHASNVPQCSLAIEQVFSDAGFPDGTFQSLLIGSGKIEKLLENDHVKAVTLTGSGPAGSKVAAKAGSEIKKSVLELGGNNPFVVLADADIDRAVEVGVKARFMNTGQSCIAAKRFIIEEEVYQEFESKFIEAVKKLKLGNPSGEVDLGPLAREDLAETLQKQVDDSISQGATLTLGGTHNKAFFDATILTGVTENMTAFKDELFGPVAPLIKAKNRDHVLSLINNSQFGLGVSIMTENPYNCEDLIAGIEDGAVFINSLVKSDPRLPFGGTKKSGYGRELSKDGIMEFVNKKTVYLKV